ncbi:hypothetical protein AVEN_194232-1 [Araneus ventricosus]|uniref:Uncharacterized protein n=1 Tax=Araneus ventricosus TaxID=182803 RepID=A0A4Y2HHK6_ARAVE|nr:hypothetical protein AVEN_194232-1 [Araneus ventricosus]
MGPHLFKLSRKCMFPFRTFLCIRTIFAALFTGFSIEGICIPVRGFFAMLGIEIILRKSLDPVSYLAFRFLQIQKPYQGSMISPEKKFTSIGGSDGNAL